MWGVRKKFRGWIAANGNRHVGFAGAVVGLRRHQHVNNHQPEPHERFVYVGCIHGGSPSIFDRLEYVLKDPPDYCIFAGDVTGSIEIESLKRKFYDTKEKNPASECAQFEYFGDWAATLPREKRLHLVSTVEASATYFLHVLEKIKKKGTRVVLLEGNWDNPITSGVKTIAGNDIHNVFDTKTFFTQHGFPFIHSLKTIETKTTVHIFLPYIVLLHFDLIPYRKLKELRGICRNASHCGKTIVMVGHAEANWKMHHLYQKGRNGQLIVPTKRRARVIHNFARAMSIFEPDEVMYPHQHARIRDEKGHLVDLNAKYALQTVRGKTRWDGYVRLVNYSVEQEKHEGQIIATYVPFGYTAEEEFTNFMEQ